MREHEVNFKERFIRGYYLDDTSICDELIEYHNNDPERHSGVIFNKGEMKVVKDYKDSIDSILKDPLAIKYFNSLQLCVDQYIEEYPWCSKGSNWRVQETVNIQYYPPGGGYPAWHTEREQMNAPYCHRHLVFMTYLNDVTDEGETEFFHQQLKMKPEKGLTLIWPSDWTFYHRGVISPSQEKYIITGWFSYY